MISEKNSFAWQIVQKVLISQKGTIIAWQKVLIGQRGTIFPFIWEDVISKWLEFYMINDYNIEKFSESECGKEMVIT